MTPQSMHASPPTSGGNGDLYKRITPGRVSGMIVDQIRLLIRDGQVKPGERLPSERELGEKFGVSRVSVREALRGLEASGLVTIKVGGGGGAFVTAPTSAQVGEGIVDLLAMSKLTPAEVTEARQVFELGIIPLVCERADELDIAELLEICDRGDAALAEGSYPMSLSAEFHSRVAQASKNAAIVMLADSFQGPTRRSLEQVKEEHPEMGVRGNKEHRQFVAAVSKRDRDEATAIMRAHIARTAKHVSKSD